MNKHVLLILYIIFFFHGCHIYNNLNKSVIQTKQLNLIDFDSALENTITKILKLNNILTSDNVLFFVDIPENNTDLILNQENLIRLIKIKFNQKNKKISFLKTQIIEKSKKKFGILNINNPLETNAAMLLSRKNHAQYYLRSSMFGKNNPYLLKIELIFVKTGEIMFTEIEKFYYKNSIYK